MPITRPLFVRAAGARWSVFRRNGQGKQRIVAGPFDTLAAAQRYIERRQAGA